MIERIVLLCILVLIGISTNFLDAFPLVMSVLIVGGAILGCIGMGRWCIKDAEWDLSFCLGVGTIGTLALPLAYVGWMVALPGLFILGWWRLYQHSDNLRFPRLSQGHLVLLSGMILFLVWNSTLAISDTDALYYHLALPRHFWTEDQLLYGELHPNASRPLLNHLVYTAIFGCSNLSSVVLFSSMCALGAWVSIIQMVQAQNSTLSWGVWAVVLGSYSLLEQLTVVNTNMMVLWCCVLAYRYRQDERLGVLGALVGFSIAGKFTAIGVAGLIGLTSGTRYFWKEALIALFLIAVWPLRNVLDGLHPLFPYVGWAIDMPFMYVEKYGMGRDLASMLLLPWNVLQHAKIQSVQFMGQLSPVFWVLILAWIYEYRDLRRTWTVWTIAIGGGVFWAMGPHWIRHLTPLMGVFIMLSLCSRWTNPRWIHGLIGVAFCVGMPSNVAPFIQNTYERWQDEITVPGRVATEWLNQHVEDETVALLFLWTGAELDVPYVLSSVEDHTPLRHWVLKYGDASIQELKSRGVRWIAVGPHAFHRSAYRFISNEDFEAQWQKPVASLDKMLMIEARWITKQDGVDIYYLP